MVRDARLGRDPVPVLECSDDALRAGLRPESGRRLASGDDDGKASSSGTSRPAGPVRQFATGGPIWSIYFLDGGRRLVTHGSDSLLLCNLETGDVARRVTLPGGDPQVRGRSATQPPGRGVLERSDRQPLTPGLSPGHRLENAHKGTVECLALSPDGRLMATGGEDHRVVLRDPRPLSRC